MMKEALLVILGLAVMASPFMLKACNGEQVPVPGINQLVDAIHGTTAEEEEEMDETVTDEEEEQVEPDLSMSRMMVERDMKRITAFENADGYLVVRTDDEYSDLVAALSRFRVSDGAQAALNEARENRGFPLFFSVALGEAVETEPLDRIVGTAVVEGCKDREEAYPLPKGAEWFTIGSNPLATAGELHTPSFKTIREFVEKEIAPIAGSADKDAILNAARAGFESDLKFFGVRSTPGIMSAKIWRTYKGQTTEESIPAIRFLPFMEQRAVSTHPAHAEARRDLAEAMDLDPDRLEEEIKGLAQETNARRALVTYWPHKSDLRVEVPTASTNVDVRILTSEDLWREAYSVGSATVGVQGSIYDLELKILDDLGLSKIVKGKKMYLHHLLPKVFVRLTQESRSGAEGKIISYRSAQELSAEVIRNAAQIQAVIQRILDQNPAQTHFEYGCLQTREEIMAIFAEYQKGFQNQSDAFPCRLGYDYTTRSVILFQKEGGEQGPTSTTDTAEALGSYGLLDFSEKSIKKMKGLVAKDHGVNIPTNPEEYKSLANQVIKEKGLSAKIDGNKVTGGYYIQLDVFKDTVKVDVVKKKEVADATTARR